MQYAIATKLDTNAYIRMDINELHEYLSTAGAEAYEVIKLDESRRVIPYYDFDAVIPDGMDEESQYCLVNWLRNYVKQHWAKNGYADCTVSVCTCIRTTVAGLKFSAHLYVHGVGSFDSALKLYQFRDAKHVAELRADFLGAKFIIKKDELFDSSVYKAADKQQKFRVLNSIKKAKNGSGTDVVFSWCDEDDDADTEFTKARLVKCMATVPADLLPHNDNDYNIKAVAPPKAPKAPKKATAAATAANDDDDYSEDRSNFPPVTADDCKRMMRALPTHPFKTNRDDWRDIISAYYGCSLQYPDYGYERKDMLVFALEWSKCDDYPQATEAERNATLDEIKKIMYGAFEAKKKPGYLIRMSKQYAQKTDLCDFTDDEVVDTDYSDLINAFDSMRTARELSKFLAGCTRMINSKETHVYVRNNNAYEELELKTMFTSLLTMPLPHGEKRMKPKEILDALIASKYFRNNNVCASFMFLPYAYGKNDEVADRKVWNRFTGWRYKVLTQEERVAGEQSIFMNHLNTMFDDESSVNIFKQWLAYCVQRPAAKADCMVVMGEQGTGKSFTQKLISHIFAGYTLAVNNLGNQVLSKFNDSLENKLMIVCGEMHADGKSITNTETFKEMITNNTVTIEPKFQKQREIVFPAKFLITTNHTTAIRLERDSRRFRFLNASNRYKDNFDYFAKLFDAVQNDQHQMNLFFTELNELDVKGFQPFSVRSDSAPMSKLQMDMQIDNMPVVYRYLIEKLFYAKYPAFSLDADKGEHDSSDLPTVWYSSTQLYTDYSNACTSRGFVKCCSTSTRMTQAINELNTCVPGVYVPKTKSNMRGYELNGPLFIKAIKKYLKTDADPFKCDAFFM